jgi:hypothetical protein
MEDGTKDVGRRAAVLAIGLTVGCVDLTVLGSLGPVQPHLYSGGDLVVRPSRRYSVFEIEGCSTTHEQGSQELGRSERSDFDG